MSQPPVDLNVHCVVFGLEDAELKVLLVRRNSGNGTQWGLPGGSVRNDEKLERAARRQLVEETGLTTFYLEQLYTFGERRRDTDTRVITVAYYALVEMTAYQHQACAGGVEKATWFATTRLPRLV